MRNKSEMKVLLVGFAILVRCRSVRSQLWRIVHGVQREALFNGEIVDVGGIVAARRNADEEILS